MRYLVRASVKPGQEAALRQAIEEGTLGQGSVAEGEYLRNMAQARLIEDGLVRWVEVCYCRLPLEEERPYWEEYFDLIKVQDAHNHQSCRDWNGEEWWACSDWVLQTEYPLSSPPLEHNPYYHPFNRKTTIKPARHSACILKLSAHPLSLPLLQQPSVQGRGRLMVGSIGRSRLCQPAWPLQIPAQLGMAALAGSSQDGFNLWYNIPGGGLQSRPLGC